MQGNICRPGVPSSKLGCVSTPPQMQRAPDLPAAAVDAADAVNLLLAAGELPRDIHYAVLLSSADRRRFLQKAGPFVSPIPKKFFQADRIWVFLWQERPGQPFGKWMLCEPAELIAASLRHYFGKTPWT